MAVADEPKTAQGVIMSSLAAWRDVAVRLGKVLTRKAYPLHRNEHISPFFIVGAGRSGTTLLRRMLVASKQVHIPPETYVLAQVIEYYRRNAYQDWESLVLHCMALFEMHPEFETFQISLRALLPKLYALPETQRSLAKMLDMFYRYHAEQTGVVCERWGDKTPINTFALDDIYAVFPQAKFIHLLRDGVDVVHSYMSSGLIGGLEDAAQRWQELVLLAQSFTQKHSEQCIELRYEALSMGSDAELRRGCHFLGLVYDESMLTKYEHVGKMGDMKHYQHYIHANQALTSEHIGKGHQALSDVDKQALQALIGRTLRDMGYDPC